MIWLEKGVPAHQFNTQSSLATNFHNLTALIGLMANNQIELLHYPSKKKKNLCRDATCINTFAERTMNHLAIKGLKHPLRQKNIKY